MVCCIAGLRWSNDASMAVEIAAENFRQHLCLGPSPSCILQYFPENHPPIASLSFNKLAESGCTRK